MKQKLFLDVGIDKIDKKYIVEKKKNSKYQTTHYVVSKENRKQVRRKVGDYFVMHFTYEKLYANKKIVEKELIRIIKIFLKKYDNAEKVLVVGLGNENVFGDSLGIKVTNKVIATNQYQDFLTIPKIALFNPSVTDKTGINSYRLIEMVVHDLKPNIIIMIDSLATKKEEHLNCAIEINNTGIIPGSAINAAREINENSFHIPILSIGVPCCLEIGKKFYTSVFIEEVITHTSDIIAGALNHIFLSR